ncbi:MAG: hypothetical protein NTW60_00930 [Candidatus Wolfebacteria bacterium]|nr:hypothetical protein [Candidatus Wolfebacteria bacterium]
MKFNSEKTKLVVTSIIVGANILALTLGGLAMAQNTQSGLDRILPKVGPSTTGGLVDLVRGINKWVYIVFFIAAVFFLLMAAFNFLRAGGDPTKASTAKNMLIYAAVAVAIAFLSVGFEQIIGTFLTNPNA